jgi:diadenosine tetraphosphate (Ap4A) HIT family hydrolase
MLSLMSAREPECPLCNRIRAGEVLRSHGTAAAIPDRFPISKGHTLIVPTRHEADFFVLSNEEQMDLLRLTDEIRSELGVSLRPDGFNIGINAGAAAGQTVGHAHVHVIPRFAGDVPDPRGGIRWVVPERAPYWRT